MNPDGASSSLAAQDEADMYALSFTLNQLNSGVSIFKADSDGNFHEVHCNRSVTPGGNSYPTVICP